MKAAVLKTAVGAKPTGGSNPSPSAKGLERWPSGRRRHPAKVLHRENRCRGFESRPLRQKARDLPGLPFCSLGGMELPLPPLLPCRILRRANRFVVEADVGPLHLANTGRLTELLLPGTRGHYHPRPTAKTRGRLYLVEREGVLVGVDATLAGPLLERLLRAGRYGPLEALRREVGLQGERLDFWARVGGREAFFEAKNANRLEGALALLKTLPQVASARLQGRSVVFEGEPEAALAFLGANPTRIDGVEVVASLLPLLRERKGKVLAHRLDLEAPTLSAVGAGTLVL